MAFPEIQSTAVSQPEASPFPDEVEIKDLYEVFTISNEEFCPRALPCEAIPLLSVKVGGVCNEIFSLTSSYELSDVCQYPLSELQWRVVCRARQLDGIGSLNHQLSSRNLLFIAEIIETLFELCPVGDVWRFKKRQKGQEASSLIVDPEHELGIVFLHKTLKEGLCKKVKLAIGVPYDPLSLSFQLASKVNRTVMANGYLNGGASRWRYEMFFKEMEVSGEVCEAIEGYSYFPDVFAAFRYDKQVGGQLENSLSIEKLCVVEELLANGKTFLFDKVSPFAQFQFFAKLVEALALLGNRIHGDLSPSSVLFENGVDGDVRVKLTGGGSSCIPWLWEKNYAMEHGFYGYPAYTAPEVVEKDPSSVDWYKAEAWALGCCLYSWLCGQDVFWGSFFSELQKSKMPPSPADLLSLKERIKTLVEGEKETVRRESHRTVKSEIMAHCLQLLEVNPDQRLSVPQLNELINSLAGSVGHPFQVAAQNLYTQTS